MKLNNFSTGLFCPLDDLAPLGTVSVFLLGFQLLWVLQKDGSLPIVGIDGFTRLLDREECIYGALGK
jgi:hypothetical protein